VDANMTNAVKKGGRGTRSPCVRDRNVAIERQKQPKIPFFGQPSRNKAVTDTRVARWAKNPENRDNLVPLRIRVKCMDTFGS
jgi:hypothetical protein